MAEYREVWPDDLKALARQAYRCQCRVKNLEAAVSHVDPREFGALMDELELAIEDCRTVVSKIQAAERKWDEQNRPTWGHHA